MGLLRCTILLALAHAAAAQSVPVLAELFTSEGCSSCPPADALLQRLDSLQPVPGAQIIVLSEHVDYWNSLGWRDPYSAPQFSRRQEDYARTLGSETYTPQLVIDGREQMNGSSDGEAQAAIARAARRPKLPVQIVSVARDGPAAVVEISIGSDRARAAVWIAVADEAARSSVNRGENSGRTLDHVAVVRSLTRAGSLNKSGFEKTIRVPVGAAAARVVVFVADPGGPVLGAASAGLR